MRAGLARAALAALALASLATAVEAWTPAAFALGGGGGGGSGGGHEEAGSGARILEDARGRRRLELPLDRRLRSDDRRLLRALDASNTFKELAQISREQDGVYWSWLHIGPNKEDVFSVIVDTGSSTIAVPCAGCSCGKHNHFDPSKSAGAETLSSTYSQCYSEGSCNRGTNVRAPMCLGKSCDVSREGLEHAFGCCKTYANPFKRQFADGIIGMMGGNSQTLIGSLRKEHRLQEDLFSMCLASHTGVLGVGGFDESRHLEPIQWTPLTSSGFYKVTVEHFHVEGQAVQLSRSLKSPIVDSGTTFTYVQTHVASALTSAFKSFCSKPGKCPGEMNPSSAHPDDLRDSIMCYAPPADKDYSADLDPWLELFPTLELEFKAYGDTKARICVPPGGYFFRSSQAYCVGILKDPRESFVLGALTMSGFDYVFDHGNNRLGIARSICDRSRDNEPGTRTSRAECCGSCAVAQKNGFNQAAAVQAPTSEPKATASPTAPETLPPRTPPPSEASVPESTSKKKTQDGMFYVSTNSARFGNKTVLEPVYDSEWSVTAYTFLPEHVLYITRAANLCEQDDPSKAWAFAPRGLVVIEGHDAVVTVGANCALPNVLLNEGATLRTKPGPAGSISVGDAEETPTYRIRIDGLLDIRKAHVVVSPASTLSFSAQSEGVSMLPTARLSLEMQSGLQCINLSHDRRLELAHGIIDVSAGAIVGCYTFVGDTASMTVAPDPEGEVLDPATFLGKLEIAGTLTMVINRNPFRAFSLRTRNTISWALMHYKPKLRIIEQAEGADESLLFRDVTEKARLYGTRDNTSEDHPASVEFSDIFHCAKVQIDETFSQLTFPSERCLNRCLDDHDVECPPEEQDFYPWPPGADDSDDTLTDDDLYADDDEEEKEEPWFDLSSYKGYVGDSVQDPAVQKSATGGAFLGVLMAIVVFCVTYPPGFMGACCRRCCCCCSGRRGSGPRHTYDNI